MSKTLSPAHELTLEPTADGTRWACSCGEAGGDVLPYSGPLGTRARALAAFRRHYKAVTA